MSRAIISALAALATLGLASPGPASATHVGANEAEPYPALPHAQWTAAQTSSTTPQRLGVVITIHGGAWLAVGAVPMNAMRPEVERFSSRGFQVVNITYRPGLAGVGDVLAAYDRARARVGRRTAICALGHSAGGHLALMLAARRPNLACVVAKAAPTDLPSLGGSLQAEQARAYAVGAFGAEGLAHYSPARLSSRVPALLVNAREDAVIPPSQLRRYRRRHRNSEAMVLRAGSERFVHVGGVSARDLRRSRVRAHAFVRRCSGRWRNSQASRRQAHAAVR